MSVVMSQENKLMRRVAGYHNFRLDGIGDILLRARDASVLDLGCSHGQVGHDFVLNGCKVLHGCDLNPEVVHVAANWFHDFRQIESKFVVCDLSRGPQALKEAFGDRKYDIILMIAVYHKLKRVMNPVAIGDLMRDLGGRTDKYFCWRATSDKPHENVEEMGNIDKWFGHVGLKRVQTSTLSQQLAHAAIWARL